MVINKLYTTNYKSKSNWSLNMKINKLLTSSKTLTGHSLTSQIHNISKHNVGEGGASATPFALNDVFCIWLLTYIHSFFIGKTMDMSCLNYKHTNYHMPSLNKTWALETGRVKHVTLAPYGGARVTPLFSSIAMWSLSKVTRNLI